MNFKLMKFIKIDIVRFSSQPTLWPTLKNPWVQELENGEIKFDKSNYKYKYSTSSELFNRVYKYLPLATVPRPPKLLDGEATVSGWIAPNPNKTAHLPYQIARNRNHSLPVYLREVGRHYTEKCGGKRDLTEVKKISGDIWELGAELKSFLEPITDGPVIMQIHEPGCHIKINGNFVEEICELLLKKGF